MSLTKHQFKILIDSMNYLRAGDRLLIKGSAGVGKTYMVNYLVKQLRNNPNGKQDIQSLLSMMKSLSVDKRIYCSAPTNKAVAVLKGKVDILPGIDFITTHSALKMRKKIDEKDGKIFFEPYYNEKYPPLKGVDYLIIDEASMLNTVLLEYVEYFAKRFSVKVIFIGDEKQLPPVGEKVSPVFTQNYPEVELTEIVRQGEGNPIIDLSRNLHKIRAKIENVIEGKGYLHSNDYARVIETLAYVNGTDELKYLAWTNKDVDKMNTAVRKRLYGDTPNKVEKGETLIFNTPFLVEYFTNEEFVVNDFEIKTRDEEFITDKKKNLYSKRKLSCYIIPHPTKPPIKILHEDSETEYRKAIAFLKAQALKKQIEWRDFFEFKERFADIKYNHALTIHKSQGSTYKQSIINYKNVCLNRDLDERQKMLYTAVTRASDLLILYKV